MTTRRVATPTRTRSTYDTPPFDLLPGQLERAWGTPPDLTLLEPTTPTVRKFYGTGTRIVLETSDPILPPTYRAGFIEAHLSAQPYLYFILKWGDLPSHDPLDARHTVIAHQPRGNQAPFYNLATGRPFSVSGAQAAERTKWEEWARREPRRPVN